MLFLMLVIIYCIMLYICSPIFPGSPAEIRLRMTRGVFPMGPAAFACISGIVSESWEKRCYLKRYWHLLRKYERNDVRDLIKRNDATANGTKMTYQRKEAIEWKGQNEVILCLRSRSYLTSSDKWEGADKSSCPDKLAKVEKEECDKRRRKWKDQYWKKRSSIDWFSKSNSFMLWT